MADVELVGPALDLLAVGLALEQRPQQQLADAEREREQADDAGAVASKPYTAIAVSEAVASSHGSTGR